MSEIPPSSQPEPPSGGYVEYPRAFAQSVPPGWGPAMVDLGVLGRAWTCFQANMATWVMACLVSGLIFGVFYGGFFAALMVSNPAFMRAGDPSRQVDLAEFFVFFVIELVGIFVLTMVQWWLNACLMSLALKQLGGAATSVGSMFDLRGQSLQILLATLVTSVLVGIGSVMCIVPGLLLQGLFMFVQPIILDKRVSAIEAVKMSFETLKPQMWMALLVHFVLLLVAQLGLVACIAGVLFTYPIYILSVALMYRDFFWPRPGLAYELPKSP